MAEDAPTEDLSEDTREAQDSQPESLRVDSLAQVLGTTNERVLQALTELDGRPRTAESAVAQDEAQRVREALADGADTAQTPQAADAAGDPNGAAQPADAAEPSNGDEPESRLILETPEEAPERAEYMPLFVAPQPVRFEYDDDDDDDDNDDDDDDDGQDGEDDQSERPSGRRRRRGRRGRGRGRGEQNGDDSDGDASQGGSQGGDQDGDESDDSDEDSGDDESIGTDGATRRRRRRRRRKSGSGDDSDAASPDDPPNTVVHEREPRKSTRNDKSGSGDSEIQGISGSTRLEAKRQRRRDGRDAGRRRPPILSEAEFLARREAVERMMVVRDKVRTEPPHEGARYTQIAVLEDGVVVEHFVTSAASASLVGNIYLGIVQNVLPSMEAAFVDIGRGRNGVLYAGEVNWEAAGLGGASRKIEQALKPGDYVVVQVSKDPVGHKGARLTTQVSLAGRYLVYVPGASSTGISRKLPDTERQRLKEILREVVPPDAGVIIRTASEGVKEEDIRNDVERLAKRWSEIEAKAADITAKKAGAAVALYEEPDVLVKVIRDLFNEDFTGLTVSGDDAWKTINDYVNSVAPELLPRLTKYEPASPDGPDVFAVHRIDEQLTKAMDRKVWLPSGGTLVIDRTEAMTVVDVNTGKFTGSGGNLEQTVTRNNLEAAEEIVRQLRLRDIGGIVVIDFIDMVLESNRDLVLRRLTEALARDRTRHQVSEVTSLGLVQLTRKRLGTGLVEAFSTPCTHCAGRGIVLHGDPVDSTSSSGRKSDTGGRRGKRGKRGGKSDDVAVAKVPPHPAGEHPMFKAMAAANGRHDADEDETTDDQRGEQKPEEAAETEAEAHSEAIRTAVIESGEDDIEDLEDEDFDEDSDEDDESDEDSDEDEDEIDLDSDDDEDDIDDDIEVIGADDSDDDEDEDSDDGDSDEDDESDDYDTRGVGSAAVSGGRHRRRAAARPAGPPRREG
ncbi:Rne/Rng family ribonuclease [Mycolicibacterium novocastrense]|uniref:Ribonuclease E n=1 Tax=Mycolicibacterium novocastrense TaxID=59813 RepID=A0AAW5SUK0_MYCNV|nr:Rne/Rng family ribonuclease [Mycolicibacterium novocastrense]MCV7027438.1 Rne/Rng family ribonuclease [Mycolicibacterium novocastrense]GAT07227.1 ribonuclease E rne [Mycolicibacterium novocastrense]